MNKFAEYCNLLLEADGSNLYNFCSSHNLERTGIRRMLSGERLPKEELFIQFERALTLTPDETKKLHELYEREKIGERRYENRIFIKEMLEYIGKVQLFPEDLANSPENAAAVELKMGKNRVIENHGELIASIRCAIRNEEKKLYSNFPITDPALFQILSQELCRGQRKIEFYHLLTIQKKSELSVDVNYNLKLLKCVLPLAMYQQNHYTPMCCYGDTTQIQGFNLYPYFLNSSSCLILLSSDLDSGLLVTDPHFLKAYTDEIRKLMQISKPFVTKTQSMEDMVENYYQKCAAVSEVSYSLDYYPCILEAYSRNRFYPCLKIEEAYCKRLVQLMETMMPCVEGNRSYICFLSMEGLTDFAKTGKIGHQFDGILHPFPKEVRKEILEVLADHCRNGKIQLHILTEKFLHPFPQIAMELYKNRRVVFLSHDIRSTFCYLDENTIYDALKDYFESLLERPEVLSVQSTIQRLEEVKDGIK